MEVTVEGLGRCVALCLRTLRPTVGDAGWDKPAGDLTWTCRRTLDHIADVLLLYAAHLGREADEQLPVLRTGDPYAGVPELFDVVDSAATLLACVAVASDPDVRAYHPAGMADVTGFLAMACDEILIHTEDIAQGLGREFAPPRDLVAPVLERLFPWAPDDVDAWDALRWSNGRIALPRTPRQGADWCWHCAPLSEWDGTITRYTRPPLW